MYILNDERCKSDSDAKGSAVKGLNPYLCLSRIAYQTPSRLKLAAIDIGSNAVRCQISSVLHHEDHTFFKKLEYIRYPMRLGEDVFQSGYISDAKAAKFIKLLHSLKLLMDVHEVDACMICATSAMREAKNTPQIVRQVKEKLGMLIEVIDGQEEAFLVNKVIINQLDMRNYLHIDVGGGSTELNVYVNREKKASQSFEVGSIRSIKGKDSADIREGMKSWIREQTKQYKIYRAIGTGGNIGKLYDLSKKLPNRPLFRPQMERIIERIDSMSMDDRINILLLNPDRADVIVPAAHIYLSAMKYARVRSILVPTVGLKDGMIQSLYERLTIEHPDHFPPAIVTDSDTA